MIDVVNILISTLILFVLGLITTLIWGFDLPKIIVTIIYLIIFAIWGLAMISQDDIVEGAKLIADFLIYVILPMAIGEAFGDALGSIFKNKSY